MKCEVTDGSWPRRSVLANGLHFTLQMHMFIARYCDLLNVDISCDGCDEIAPWHRYRCLQCSDMDLCKTCFLGAHCAQGTPGPGPGPMSFVCLLLGEVPPGLLSACCGGVPGTRTLVSDVPLPATLLGVGTLCTNECRRALQRSSGGWFSLDQAECTRRPRTKADLGTFDRSWRVSAEVWWVDSRERLSAVCAWPGRERSSACLGSAPGQGCAC